MVNRQKGPKLKFGQTTAMTGFTAIDTASFNDLRPAPIIRELIQNSLDAAVEVGKKTAVIRFRVKQIGSRDVPDIAGYEKHFRAAVNEHNRNGGLSDAAQQVVDNIEKALKLLTKGNHYSLSILDNGIGLDHTRMTSLLGQGTSVKSVEASGSYGVGHLASIPASDLRYVLYGGVVKGGQRTVSGCAVLASRSGRTHPYAAQGYLVKGFGSGKDGKIYDFIGPRSFPDAVAADLKEIESEWGHGSTVVIPAFNCFGDDRNFSLWEVVSRVAAYNFNAAIYQGNLAIEVIEADKKRLDKRTLKDVLEQDKDSKRVARKGSFFQGLRPSGENAHATYLALTEGKPHLVQTEDGDVNMRLLTPSPIGNTRIDLFRNGMWITDRIPGLSRADFTDRQPFHAVLTLNAKEGKGLHRLIRKAEGPMHDKLAFNLLSLEEGKKLRVAIRQIANKIRAEIPEIGTEEYTPDDYLLIETGGQEPGDTTRQYSMWGFPVPIQRARISQRRFSESGETTEHEGDSKGKGQKKPIKKKSQKQRSTSRPLSFRSTAIPDGAGRHVVAIECSETFDEVLLSLRVDENMDATCDRVWPDERVLLKSFEIEARGGPAPSSKMEDDKKAIQISGLSAGTTYKLVLKYEVPEELANLVEVPVFRVDLHSPPPSK